MTLIVELTRLIPATPERVFDAWLDPVAISRFMCPAPGVISRSVEVDARVGGRFSLVMVAGTTEIPIHGEYVELDRPATLAFTWLSHRTESTSRVNLTFAAEGTSTRMTLRHTGFPDASARDDHEGGWSHIAEALAADVAA